MGGKTRRKRRRPARESQNKQQPARIRFFFAPSRVDWAFILALTVFLALTLLERAAAGATPYAWLSALHRELGRLLLGSALVMALVGAYIGLWQRGDVRPWYRRLSYLIAAYLLGQFFLGLVLYLLGGRPAENVHLIYGLGALLVIPFFAFVEITAQKRPAMGCYIWAFTMLSGIALRTLLTGA